MALPGQEFNKVPADKEGDLQFMASVGLVPTKNNTGCMFLQVGGYVNDWLNEWKVGSKPLLDIGCAYGIHTLHALKSGCDVIAADMSEAHISELQKKAMRSEYSAGNLISSHVMRLPTESPSSILPQASVSAVLISEVLHFLQVGEPLPALKQVFDWLVPGGRLFVSTASPKGFENIIKHGAKMNGGSSEEEIMDLVKKCTEEEIIRIGPTFTTFADCSALKTLYYMTTDELGALARLAGFEIERLEYHSPRKYQVSYAERDESVLLVARKPQ